MKRLGWTQLIVGACGVAAAGWAVACSSGDDDGDAPCVGAGCGAGGDSNMGAGGGSNGSSGSGTIQGAAVCNAEMGVECVAEGQCFPDKAAEVCYGASKDGVGDECFAKRIQSVGSANEKHRQFKVAWSRSTRPPGNLSELVYTVLSQGAGIPQPPEQCFQSGLGVFQQLLDVDVRDSDMANHRVYTGWAQLTDTVEKSADAVANGLCMITQSYSGNSAYNLDVMSPTTGWPENMPPPMPRGPRGQAAQAPWDVKPTVLIRRATDFDMATDRQTLLGEIAAVDGAGGITYMNDETGFTHSYVPLSWVIVTLGVPIAIPIREVETTYQENDPTEHACIGAWRGGALDPAADCVSKQDPNNPEWGWYKDMAPSGTTAKGTAPGLTKGYFLITELEQVYSDTQQQTLCVSYPGLETDGTTPKMETEGFFDSTIRSCVSDKWDPTNPATGLPMGDWCAATNAPATADCHDAWRSETWQVFQAFPVKPQGTACPLQP